MLLGPGSSLPLYCPDDRIPLPDCPIYVCNTPLFVLCFYCYWEEDPTAVVTPETSHFCWPDPIS